jgi:hypothetical protein
MASFIEALRQSFAVDSSWSVVRIPKMQIPLLRTLLFLDEPLPEDGDGGNPLRKVAVVGIVRNPQAGRRGDDLTDMIAASAELGRSLSKHAVAAMAPYSVCSYGKGGIVGLDGEQEHINALVTSTFAAPLREAIGGAAAWISSFTKRAAPGSSIDVPLAHKDALYVRSHYDGMTITVPDGPQADEIAVIICVANRGRINDRVGGLRAGEIVGKDGLR